MRFYPSIACVIIVALFGACKKKPAVEVDPAFVGHWGHRNGANSSVSLSIEEDSKGFIERRENGKFNDTQRRKWLIKKDNLYFGWLGARNEKFSIDQYPTVAGSIIIHDLDTVQAGEKYMILDGDYYVD